MTRGTPWYLGKPHGMGTSGGNYGHINLTKIMGMGYFQTKPNDSARQPKPLDLTEGESMTEGQALGSPNYRSVPNVLWSHSMN